MSLQKTICFCFLLCGLATPVAGQLPGACQQCVPSPNGGYSCLDNQWIGWDRCFPGPTCDHGQDCNMAGGGCFVAGTRVLVRGGDVPIELLEIGDEVLSEREDGTREYCRVSRTYKGLQAGYWLINGSLSVTGDHPFRSGGNWVLAEQLNVGDTLIGPDDSVVVVESIQEVDFGVRVYNIEVDNLHTFYANGVLVHNKGPNPNG